jgi:hypothetical protein
MFAGVRQNIQVSKIVDQTQYNQGHKVQDPIWKIGEEVLITNKCIRKNSDQILTRPNYHGSFYITDIIQNPGFGPSYRLVRKSDGRPLHYLISGSRLRAYTASHRADFHAKYPELPAKAPVTPEASAASEATASGSEALGEQTQASADNQVLCNERAGESSNTSPVYEPAIKNITATKKEWKNGIFSSF